MPDEPAAADAQPAHRPRLRRSPNLVFVFAANSVSQFAQGITMLSIPWYLVSHWGEQGGKELNAAMIGTVTLITLAWSLYSGTLVDRYNRRSIFLSINGTGFALLSFGALYCWLSGTVPFPLLALMFASAMCINAIHFPNLYAFTQELFAPVHYARVNASIEIQGQLTQIVGMTVGSLLIAGTENLPWWPATWAVPAWQLWQIFLLNAAAYAVAFCIIRLIRYRPRKHTAEFGDGVFKRLGTGLNYLWHNPRVLLFGLCAYSVFFGALILIQVLLPVFVNDVLRGEGSLMALAQAALAAGALGSALLNIALSRTRQNPALEVVLTLIMAVGLILGMAIGRSPIILVGCMLGYGVVNAAARIHRVTYVQSNVPSHLLGRVHSSLMFINYSLRAAFVYLLSMPFFAAPGNGSNVVYGMVLLACLLALSAGLLLYNYRRFAPAPVRQRA